MVKSVIALPRAAAFSALTVVPVVLLSACSPNEPIATEPGTTPPVWTGSPAPSGDHGEGHGAGHGAAPAGAPAAAGPTDTLTAQIKGPDGTQVAAATIEFQGGFATVTVQTTGPGALSPGAHGLHIHAIGKCEPNSVAPAGGAPGDFLSAGGHFASPGDNHPNHAGDLSSLQVRDDGTALLVTTTSAFTKEQLLAAPGTAIMIHDAPDNFSNIPTDRYTPAPDATTLATGDAGKRVACGVISAG
ncbi:MAG TPA: superoxide dismutase family protein [Mycobacterium sp.]|nr:superoxide dismutase family protein [Mycobacterium sp.]HPZ95256.1 superoxide dismutase family protein [Mycobacterium sp.]HQE15601.1 superoxide dismutase family protein [Mycobacterium sp.]